MDTDTPKDIKLLRSRGLPLELRKAITDARRERGWSQRDLTSRARLTQRHISGIESGKIVPRYDTILELVRNLDHDLVMVPRSLVPIVRAMVRDYIHPQSSEAEERSLYSDLVDEDTKPTPLDEV